MCMDDDGEEFTYDDDDGNGVCMVMYLCAMMMVTILQDDVG